MRCSHTHTHTVSRVVTPQHRTSRRVAPVLLPTHTASNNRSVPHTRRACGSPQSQTQPQAPGLSEVMSPAMATHTHRPRVQLLPLTHSHTHTPRGRHAWWLPRTYSIGHTHRCSKVTGMSQLLSCASPASHAVTQTGFSRFCDTRTAPHAVSPTQNVPLSFCLTHVQRHTRLHSHFPLSLPVLSGLAGSTGNNQHSRKPQGLRLWGPVQGQGFSGLQPPAGPCEDRRSPFPSRVLP